MDEREVHLGASVLALKIKERFRRNYSWLPAESAQFCLGMWVWTCN